jgi:hypothetical protein
MLRTYSDPVPTEGIGCTDRGPFVSQYFTGHMIIEEYVTIKPTRHILLKED